MREIFVTELVKEVLGPRGGIYETLPSGISPLGEYITGVLAPSAPLPSADERRDIDIDAELPYTQSEGSVEDLFEADVQSFAALAPPLDPKSKPSSIGISFVLEPKGGPPCIEICVTWARYTKETDGGWRRAPRWLHTKVSLSQESIRLLFTSEGLEADSSAGAEICLHIICKRMEESQYLATVYLVNAIQSERPRVEDHLYQPQIRICACESTKIVPGLDRYPLDEIGKELAFYYRNRPVLSRGHLCSATWRSIDPEKTFGETIDFPHCNREPPFYWLDGEVVPEEIRNRFSPPHVRTDFVPLYLILSPDLSWNQDFGEEPELSAENLADAWDPSCLRRMLAPLCEGFNEWIDKMYSEAQTLPEREQKIAFKAIDRCRDVERRIRAGIDILVSDLNSRLAFCFANKAIDLQYRWRSGSGLVWHPFQLAFILMLIESIVNSSSEDRNTCDLLWVPTGAGKTEAYLAIAAFTIARRRRRALHSENTGAGVAAISRYTLRLLTIQQFRRALRLVAACEYLRVHGLAAHRGNIGWQPFGSNISDPYVWGSSQFSIGLWVGGAVTPNRLDDIWGGNRIIPGALSILKGKTGEGEPAQVLACPACGTTLSVPEKMGLAAGSEIIHWVVYSQNVDLSMLQTQAKNLEGQSCGTINITKVDVYQHESRGFYTLSLGFSSPYRVRRNDLEVLWQLVDAQIRGLQLAAIHPCRPGYFARWYLDSKNRKKYFDFEIFCPNPRCYLHQPWCGGTPSGNVFGARPHLHGPSSGVLGVPAINDGNHFVHVNTAFTLDAPFVSDRIPIPAYTVDDQIYHRIPSMVVATVDKFARPPFEPRAAAIFGNVDYHHCIKGFYREPANGHPSPTGKPSGRNYIAIASLEPPDLIIQDELHLIEGPLGSLVGIYETAVDHLSRNNGQNIKYIASTATVRNSDEQVQAIFSRRVLVFPAPALFADDRFFIRFEADAHQLKDLKPGRLYAGICAPGRGPLTPTVRIWSRLMNTAWLQRNHPSIDPFWTLVGYFNAVRELGGAKALYWQDIPGRLNEISSGNPRSIPDERSQELSSRTLSTDLPAILDLLLQEYPGAQDALLTTSMFGTGIDIPRFGLMVVQGQPKTTSAYIQSTGRVGRRRGALVVVFLRATRPRDLNHYEFFSGYHRQLHRFVEPVTVSPYSPGVIERTLGPLAVFMLRNSRGVGGVWHTKETAPQMATMRSSTDVTILPNIFEQRAQQQPAVRKPPANYVFSQMNMSLDAWQQAAARNMQNLEYVEYAISRPPSKPVVLGDPQHQHATNLEVVYRNSPQSLRDIEETTGFQT